MINNKFLVVLYKIQPSASSTIKSILSFLSSDARNPDDKYELIVWDNSPVSNKEELDALRNNTPIKVTYFISPKNISLSKIYNTISNELNDGEYLTLLDQDSFLPIKYFFELRKAHLEGYSLILPMVKCDGILVSPGTRFFSKGKLLKNVTSGAIVSKNLLAINSGMSAKANVFKTISYDERLMFYGTDTYFMKHYEKYYTHAYVIDAEINHSLAENDRETSVERKIQIAQARRAAWAIIFSETLSERIFLYVYQFALGLRALLRKAHE